MVVSGATNLGVLQLTYALCREHGLSAMGLAPQAVWSYPVADFDIMLPVGERFGDESEAFVSLCDAFVLLGGGRQSRAETLAAAARGKPVTILRGFGGVADVLTPAEVTGATWIDPT